MINKTFTISLLLLVGQAVNQVVVLPAHAQVQKCQDAQGKWHYGNKLGDICKNEADIQSVKERVKTATPVQNASRSDKELERLELKVLNDTNYLVSDLKKILAPYTTEKDVVDRFEGLKTNTTANVIEKEALLEGLQKKQIALSKDESPNAKVQTADNSVKIKSTEAEIRQLNVQLQQIEQRRTKVIALFKEYKNKLDELGTKEPTQPS